MGRGGGARTQTTRLVAPPAVSLRSLQNRRPGRSYAHGCADPLRRRPVRFELSRASRVRLVARRLLSDESTFTDCLIGTLGLLLTGAAAWARSTSSLRHVTMKAAPYFPG